MGFRPYFLRQLSTRWFNTYLIICGAAFNLFALFSAVQVISSPIDHSQWQARKVQMELEDYQQCSKHLAGQTVERGSDQKFELKSKDGQTLSVPYRSLSTSGMTQEGDPLEAVDVQFGSNKTALATSTLFLVTNFERKVKHCLPSYTGYRNQQLECLAAAGEFQSNGECSLAVNQPSDCQLMKGAIIAGICHVPASGRILRASTSNTKGVKCVALNCKK